MVWSFDLFLSYSFFNRFIFFISIIRSSLFESPNAFVPNGIRVNFKFATSGIKASKFDSLDFGKLWLLKIYKSETISENYARRFKFWFVGTTIDFKRSLKSSNVDKRQVEVEKFDWTNNFGMWQCKVMNILFKIL